MEKLFLARFFEDDTEVFVSTLLATSRRKGVYQDVCGEILEYGALISKWYDAVYIGGYLPP